ncbi:MAG: hypothetical protein Q9216_006895 [Gyalolechia sp. 2 TL-2023]
MKLYLIRHGETVDNVAQLYAGVRDSALTVQGFLQAERLAQYLAASGIRYSRVFASDLQRAVKTAEALLAAQPKQDDVQELTVQQLPVLREQDFGFYEGKPFYARQPYSDKSGKDTHRLHHQNDPSFEDVESKESMAKRTDTFLAEYLLPLICEDHPGQEVVVAIVSHGIILSQLWKSILGKFSKQTVALAPGLSIDNGGVTSLEHLGGWSNTGYLELDITTTATDAGGTCGDKVAQLEAGTDDTGKLKEVLPVPLPPSVHMLIQTVNGKEHLKGLKRARGVGSSQYDQGQKKIESFFKKSKVG